MLDQEQFDPEGPQPLHPNDDCFEEDWNEEDEDILQSTHQEFTRLHEKDSEEFVDVEEPKDEKVAREPVELNKVMIFAVPMKTKNGSTVELIIKELVLHVERKLRYKVERIHTDPGSELQAKALSLIHI